MEQQGQRRVITVGIQGDRSGRPVVRWAAAEATRRGAELRIVSVWTVPVLGWSDMGAAPNLDPTLFQEAAQAIVSAAAAHLHEELGDATPPLDLSTPEGTPAATLLAVSADSEMLVVGAHNRRSLDVLGLGSVASACAHHAALPVAIVRAGGPDSQPGVEGGAVVVGVDDSDCARAALRLAASLAAERDAPLTVVHAWNPHPWPGDESPGDATAEERAAAADAAGRVVAEELGENAPDQVTIVTPPGPAAAVLIEAAAGAALIVVGTRGRGGFARMLLGSVSSTVVQHAPCPVVVVPAAS